MNRRIRVVKRNSFLRKEPRGGGLAHPKRTCQPENKHWLTINELAVPEEIQQRQKRQSEDREIVPFYALEQVNADTFELISPDAVLIALSPIISR